MKSVTTAFIDNYEATTVRHPRYIRHQPYHAESGAILNHA